MSSNYLRKEKQLCEVNLNLDYFFIPYSFTLHDFKLAFDSMPSHWVYSFLARFVPNTSFASIDRLMGTQSSASRFYHECYKRLRHPKIQRDVFSFLLKADNES